MISNKPFAEVLESSLSSWLAQSWKWNEVPSFGSIVAVENAGKTIFGIVHQVQTGSLDAVRHPFAYQKTEEELRLEQPQIFEFLKTNFSCLLLGYMQQGKMYYMLAPQPVTVHSFVFYVQPNQAALFFTSYHYLDMLFSHGSQILNLDELLLAVLKNFSMYGISLPSHLDLFVQRYSLLIGNDYRRMKLFLNRVEQLL